MFAWKLILGTAFPVLRLLVLVSAIVENPDYPVLLSQQIPKDDLGKTIMQNDARVLPYQPLKSSRPITECMFVTSESASFTYVSKTDNDDVCGVYFLTDPDRKVEIHFLNLDVPCEQRGLVAMVDGWELNGELFPSDEDYNHLPTKERIVEFCGSKAPRIFLSSQNAAVIQYRIPKAGRGFTVFARYPKTLMPCNVLAVSINKPFTLRNYGRRINCTYTALYPSVVRIHGLRVGPVNAFREKYGVLRKCDQLSPWDQVQIGGSHGLDTSKIDLMDSICGMDLKPDYRLVIEYGVTSVRLLSSGFFENFVTVTLKPI